MSKEGPKIGELVQTVLKPLIIKKATLEEVQQMQELEYSKAAFGLTYPLLVKTSSVEKEKAKRYYRDTFTLYGDTYRLCSQWFETDANNDRPYVEKWIQEHEETASEGDQLDAAGTSTVPSNDTGDDIRFEDLLKDIRKDNKKLSMKKIFRMPTPVKVTGRTSSITNSFVNGIIPIIEPKDEEIENVLQTLGMDKEHIACAYCGDAYTEWDHFYPLVKDKMPTGYISEIHNLVPACGKCNQSKGNRHWKEWMLSNAPRSPHSRQIPDIEDRVAKLEEYERRYTPIKLDFEKIVGTEVWEQHWENCRKLHSLMQESQKHSDKIKKLIKDSIKDSN